MATKNTTSSRWLALAAVVIFCEIMALTVVLSLVLFNYFPNLAPLKFVI